VRHSRKLKKNIKTFQFGGSRSFIDIDVDTVKKLVTTVAQHCCKNDQPFHWENPQFDSPVYPKPLHFSEPKFAQMIMSGISPDVQNLVKKYVHGGLPHEQVKYNAFVTFCIFPFYERKQLLLSARLSHRNSVRPSVCLSVTRVDRATTVQARITKSSLSAARETLSFRNRKAFP